MTIVVISSLRVNQITLIWTVIKKKVHLYPFDWAKLTHLTYNKLENLDNSICITANGTRWCFWSLVLLNMQIPYFTQSIPTL